MRLIKESEIRNVPFDELAIIYSDLSKTEDDWEGYCKDKKDTNNWFVKHNIRGKSEWLFPQLLAHIARFNINCITNSGGIIDCSKFWASNLDLNSLWDRGLFLFIMKTYSRGNILGIKQSTPPGTEYCGLVPLVLASFKKYHDVPYSRWDRDTINKVVDKPLAEAMAWSGDVDDFSPEFLLEIRAKTLTLKTGAKAGQVQNPITTFKIPTDPSMNGMPKMLKLMLIQIWCAHPLNINQYMVTNPLDWDNHPEPLDGYILDELTVKQLNAAKKDDITEQVNNRKMDPLW